MASKGVNFVVIQSNLPSLVTAQETMRSMLSQHINLLPRLPQHVQHHDCFSAWTEIARAREVCKIRVCPQAQLPEQFLPWLLEQLFVHRKMLLLRHIMSFRKPPHDLFMARRPCNANQGYRALVGPAVDTDGLAWRKFDMEKTVPCGRSQ